MPFLTVQQVNLSACSPHYPLMVSVKQEAVNTNISVNSFTGLGIKPDSTAPEAVALLTRSSDLSEMQRALASHLGNRDH